jgi:serine/threonine protein kinase
MMNLTGDVRLSNFSVSTWLVSQGRSKAETLVGSPAWMAPEVAELSLGADSGDRGYNAAADIWALGITAIELATGTNPYSKFPPMKVCSERTSTTCVILISLRVWITITFALFDSLVVFGGSVTCSLLGCATDFGECSATLGTR